MGAGQRGIAPSLTVRKLAPFLAQFDGRFEMSADAASNRPLWDVCPTPPGAWEKMLDAYGRL
jgi:hypothetical protein